MKTETHQYSASGVLDAIHMMEEAGWAVRQVESYPITGLTYFLVVFEREREW